MDLHAGTNARSKTCRTKYEKGSSQSCRACEQKRKMKSKEKRKLHVRAIAELDLNASIHQAIEENEERIAEMVEKQEEEVAHHAVEAGQSIDGTENVQNDENIGDEPHPRTMNQAAILLQ